MKQITITGELNCKGELGLWNINQLNDFLDNNKPDSKKPSKTVIVTYSIPGEESRKKMLAYYYAKIVPEWKQAKLVIGEIMTRDHIDIYLRSLSPMLEHRTLSDLDREELIMYLDHIKLVSSEEMNLLIEDPRLI